MPDSACPDGIWESVPGRPTERLRPGVLRYHGFRAQFSRPRRRLELPSGTVTLVVGFDEKLSLDNAQGHEADLYSAVLAGVHASAGSGGHQGRLSGMEIVMTPWAAYSLLGAAMHELAGRHLAAEDVLGRRLGPLADALASAPDWPRRFALVDAALVSWRAAGPSCSPLVARAWDEVGVRRGLVTTDMLAETVGWGRRQLEKRFREQIGVSPKIAGRIVRLNHTLRALAAGRGLSETAAAVGFSDQSHLSREFKAMTSLRPRQFVQAIAEHRVVERIPGHLTSVLLEN
ncbi:helix-turn-helix domain-containing protein [Streptomyces sp. NPDC057757]|uniref:AraC family transcriptional regulator n=1 Tax=Streptomyces sp. NPDC057757 TaxID=3346241 RepID=UPI0036A2BC5F